VTARPTTIAGILRQAAQTLAPVTETPRLDAEILLAHALGLSRTRLLARLRDVAAPSPAFTALIERRLRYEPIAYITGAWEFFSLEFLVRPPILVPRPETEHLVEIALEHLAETRPDAPRPRVLDLCTGSGCVAVAIAKNAPHAALTATDLNPDALELATENALRHHVPVEFHQGDLFAALPADTPHFDVIVSNPPYVEEPAWPALPPVIRLHEDPRALLAGPDGLDILRRIIDDAPARLNPGGLLALEVGETQSQRVADLLQTTGYTSIHALNDLAGIPRILHAKMP
jgi:release factor glutamine methyltransferase